MITVAIVSPFRFQDSVKRAVSGQDFGCTLHTYVYDDVSDIDQICVQCRQDCNVILFTGELGYHYMRTHYPDFPVPCAFTVYGIADVLSILLSFHLRHPLIPLNRIYLDFLTPMNDYLRIQDYLPKEQLPYFFEEGNYDYTNITNRAIQLRKAGLIDCVLSRSINNLHSWQSQGIPYEAVYPTEQMIRKSIEEAINRERLKKIDETSIVTLIIHLPDSTDTPQSEKEYRLATVFKFLVDSRKEYGLAFSIQQGLDRFVCRSTHSDSEIPNLDFQKVLQLFQNTLNFPFSVGIGIHSAERQSQYRAERALLESNRFGDREGFLVSGDPEVVTGPLGKEQTVHFPYQDITVTRFARKLGIGNANLLRLVGMYRSNPSMVLSAAELGPLLGVTLRSTRRILQKLYDMGIITPSADLSEGTRGRPTHRYAFVPEALDRALSAEEA